jgi:MSHA biogenesis protein MshJ
MEKIRLWLQSLSQQQRILFLALFASVAYFIWSSLWGGYYTPERAAVSAQKKVLDDKIKDIDATTMRLKALRTDPDILATKKKLDDLREQLKKVSRQLVSSKQMLDQLNGVFTKDPEIKFSHIQNVGSTAFSLESPGQEPNKKSDSTATTTKPPASFYAHTFLITFEADYFSTEHYIQQLQQLPGQLYFDSIEYNVVKYPTASVVLKVHTISLDEG